jgi:hypothetical protein
MAQDDDGHRWGHCALTLDLDLNGDTPRLRGVRRPGAPPPPPGGLPLADLTLLGAGTGWSGPRFTGTALAQRVRHRTHHSAHSGGWHHLTVELTDPGSGLTVFAEYSSPDGEPVLRSRVRLRNDGPAPLALRAAGSLLLGGLPSPDVLDVHRARNDWLAECRWEAEPLRNAVPDIGREAHGHDARAAFRLAGRGSWPTDGHLPMGALTDRTGGPCLVWQVESAAGWVWDELVDGDAGRDELSTAGIDDRGAAAPHPVQQPLGRRQQFGILLGPGGGQRRREPVAAAVGIRGELVGQRVVRRAATPLVAAQGAAHRQDQPRVGAPYGRVGRLAQLGLRARRQGRGHQFHAVHRFPLVCRRLACAAHQYRGGFPGSLPAAARTTAPTSFFLRTGVPPKVDDRRRRCGRPGTRTGTAASRACRALGSGQFTLTALQAAATALYSVLPAP